VLIGCELCSAAAVLSLLFLQGGAMIWLICGVYLVQSFSGLFFNPASRAFIPQLVENEQLVAMNSLVSTSEALIRIIDPVVGGALFVLLGLQPVLLLESGGYLFSALMLLLFRVPVSERVPVERGQKLAGELLQGVRLIREDRVLIGLIIVLMLVRLGSGA
jgi:MFS family permease